MAEQLTNRSRIKLIDPFEFLGVDADGPAVTARVAGASFQALSGGRTRGDEDRHSFFRKGVAGDWTATVRGPFPPVWCDGAAIVDTFDTPPATL